MVNRRDVLAAAVVGGAASTAASPVAGAQPKSSRLVAPVPVNEPLVNFERAYALMEANGIDAVLVRMPTNVYYLTGYRPLFTMETYDTGPVAILTRRPADNIAVIMAAFSYYYQHADSRPDYPFAYYLFSGPDGSAAPMGSGEPSALAAGPLRDVGALPLTPTEADRSRALGAAVKSHAPSATSAWALTKAMKDLGLAKAKVAVDDPLLAAELTLLLPECTAVPGHNLIRRIRLVKTPAALALAATAAQANVEAARAAVTSTARPGATYRDLRAAYFQEVAARGGKPVGLLVNAVSTPFYDAEMKQGDCFLIDAVSEFQMFHGDYGRTICIGDPPRSIKRATAAAELGWRSVRETLKPGMTFSRIREIGQEALRKDGYDFDIRFGAHNVGLNHTEDPYRRDQPFFVSDTVVEAGMVLSVDCPVLNAGMGGSVHLEDLVQITPDGHRPLNDISHPVVVV